MVEADDDGDIVVFPGAATGFAENEEEDTVETDAIAAENADRPFLPLLLMMLLLSITAEDELEISLNPSTSLEVLLESSSLVAPFTLVDEADDDDDDNSEDIVVVPIAVAAGLAEEDNDDDNFEMAVVEIDGDDSDGGAARGFGTGSYLM